MSYFHCGNGYPDRCNGYKGPLDASVCTSGRHMYDERGRQISDPAPQPPYCGQCEDLPGVVLHAEKRSTPALSLGGFLRSGLIWISNDTGEDEDVLP